MVTHNKNTQMLVRPVGSLAVTWAGPLLVEGSERTLCKYLAKWNWALNTTLKSSTLTQQLAHLV